ncbi:hypothetical protein [Pseudomonas lurida]|uniref:Morphogenetic protein n=1 Tax=Pseudomonas lurida TaxID=244566 RepID=A0ABY9FQ29_9PSED|nr:hypothetical protein [Pseudomonas lurida]WLH05428.1 hypothetical protein PSH67_21690 [Pseudomonas lurida]
MTAIKERPILFSAPMVRAILEGRKTVTRRVCKPQPSANAHTTCASGNPMGAWWETGKDINRCPHGRPGDRLWLRESHAQVFEVDIPDGRPVGPIGTAGSPGRPDWKCRYVYRADGEMPNVQWHHVGDSQPVRWTPSIHMRREASRILLEITDVRVERLQDISEEQAKAEGVRLYSDHAELGDWWHVEGIETYSADPRKSFELLWSSVGGNWEANPWVWVVEFKRVTP